MADRFDPPRDPDWKSLPMRPDIAGQYVRYSDLAEARAEIERLTKESDEATATVELVNSNNLTLAAELAGWKQAARQMEAERGEARAQVAMAYETAARRVSLYLKEHNLPLTKRSDGAHLGMADAVRALKPADAKTALEAYGREKVREGMKRAAEIAGRKSAVMPHYHDITRGYANGRSGARDAILAAMEKEGGK
jgi:hypothetical protein